MKRIAFLLVAIAALAGVVVFTSQASGHADDQAAPIFVTEIPHGYRDWKWISVAHEAGNLNSLGAVLGNDVAIKAYREGKLPFPDGTIIAALHYHNVPSEENNKVFGRVQSFVRNPSVRNLPSWASVRIDKAETGKRTGRKFTCWVLHCIHDERESET